MRFIRNLKDIEVSQTVTIINTDTAIGNAILSDLVIPTSEDVRIDGSVNDSTSTGIGYTG